MAILSKNGTEIVRLENQKEGIRYSFRSTGAILTSYHLGERWEGWKHSVMEKKVPEEKRPWLITFLKSECGYKQL